MTTNFRLTQRVHQYFAPLVDVRRGVPNSVQRVHDHPMLDADYLTPKTGCFGGSSVPDGSMLGIYKPKLFCDRLLDVKTLRCIRFFKRDHSIRESRCGSTAYETPMRFLPRSVPDPMACIRGLKKVQRHGALVYARFAAGNTQFDHAVT